METTPIAGAGFFISTCLLIECLSENDHETVLLTVAQCSEFVALTQIKDVASGWISLGPVEILDPTRSGKRARNIDFSEAWQDI